MDLDTKNTRRPSERQLAQHYKAINYELTILINVVQSLHELIRCEKNTLVRDLLLYAQTVLMVIITMLSLVEGEGFEEYNKTKIDNVKTLWRSMVSSFSTLNEWIPNISGNLSVGCRNNDPEENEQTLIN